MVIIQHSDGNFTVYAHLEKGTITVKAGDTVRQGQVIAKVGSSGRSTGPHLHFEVREGANNIKNAVDPLNYVDPKDPRPASSSGNFSLTTTTFTKAEFVAKMDNYCKRSGNQHFCNEFSAHAELVYELSVKNRVNPELVVVTAGTEEGFQKCGGYYNFWGIGIGNGAGCEVGPHYQSLEEGIVGFAGTLVDFLPGGKRDAFIRSRYDDREKAGCDKAGHGLPGTLEGWQSVYSWPGYYRYNPGTNGLGGCVYLNGYVYPDSNYCSKKPSCTSYTMDDQYNYENKVCPDATLMTVCEQNDYTAYQLKSKHKLRQEIFGL